MTRSAELLIGALGILKAGGAYVALDPAYPTQRLLTLLDDAQAPIVVTQPGTAERVPPGAWRTVVLDRKWAGPDFPTGPLDVAWAPEHLAYVIFTSGSTGKPKGVQITHANLLNLVHWHRRAFLLTPADRATLQSSPGFDAAVWEMWPYLTAGASLYLVDEAVRASPEHLRDWLVAHHITISFLPTVLAQNMLDLH